MEWEDYHFHPSLGLDAFGDLGIAFVVTPPSSSGAAGQGMHGAVLPTNPK